MREFLWLSGVSSAEFCQWMICFRPICPFCNAVRDSQRLLICFTNLQLQFNFISCSSLDDNLLIQSNNRKLLTVVVTLIGRYERLRWPLSNLIIINTGRLLMSSALLSLKVWYRNILSNFLQSFCTSCWQKNGLFRISTFQFNDKQQHSCCQLGESVHAMLLDNVSLFILEVGRVTMISKPDKVIWCKKNYQKTTCSFLSMFWWRV